MFLDEAEVEFASGRGGSGAVSFHREKFVPRGGPNGADGGRGGDVILIADRNKRTLYDFKLIDHYSAEPGDHAVGNKRGKGGKSIEIKLPVGTIVTDTETGEVLVDLNVNGMKYTICRGGKGGFGNCHYASSIRQTPNFAQKGAPADVVRAKLELKLLADVGLVGLPNAGKSTLISRISAARPKIADYPFTTIVPNLGVVKFFDETFVVADMPGLIEGASEGVGLGHQFLKHVERNRVLVHVVDIFPVDETDPFENYELIERELKLYSEDIWQRPRIIALNKIDVIPPDQFNAIRERFEKIGHPLYPISAISGQGIDALLHEISETLKRTTPVEDAEVLRPVGRANDEPVFTIDRIADGFRVNGRRVERLVAMSSLDNSDGVRYLHRRLVRLGVIDALHDMDAQDGDTVQIGDFEFSFSDEA